MTTDCRTRDAAKAKAILDRLCKWASDDHEDTICIGHNEGCLLRDEIQRLRLAQCALRSFLAKMDRFGTWDDGCFYYNRTSAPELESVIKIARAILPKQAVRSC